MRIGGRDDLSSCSMSVSTTWIIQRLMISRDLHMYRMVQTIWWWVMLEDNGQTGLMWLEGHDNQSLLWWRAKKKKTFQKAQHVKSWGGCRATIAEDLIRFHFCQRRTGSWAYTKHQSSTYIKNLIYSIIFAMVKGIYCITSPITHANGKYLDFGMRLESG